LKIRQRQVRYLPQKAASAGEFVGKNEHSGKMQDAGQAVNPSRDGLAKAERERIKDIASLSEN
jgi:hypothetical protein